MNFKAGNDTEIWSGLYGSSRSELSKVGRNKKRKAKEFKPLSLIGWGVLSLSMTLLIVLGIWNKFFQKDCVKMIKGLDRFVKKWYMEVLPTVGSIGQIFARIPEKHLRSVLYGLYDVTVFPCMAIAPLILAGGIICWLVWAYRERLRDRVSMIFAAVSLALIVGFAGALRKVLPINPVAFIAITQILFVTVRLIIIKLKERR